MIGITIVFIGLLICLCFTMMLTYLDKTNKIDYKLWDLTTCTPADYTVELRIPLDTYKKYLQEKQNSAADPSNVQL